ncbi:hypothetical protein BSL78_00018, partial [Apostichopus japonicus]
HPWETVAQAAWRKYPNPLNPSVIGVDVLDRKVDHHGKLISHRVLTTTWGMPSWAALLIGLHPVTYASEHSVVDPKRKSFELKSSNVSLQNFISIDEKLVYSPHPTIKDATLLKQEAVVTVRGLSLANRLEQMVTNAISSKASAGREGLEMIIEKINDEMKEFASTAKKGLEEMKNSVDVLDFE